MTGTMQFDGFKAGDTFPRRDGSNSVFYAHGWVTGSQKHITCDITLPKPCPSTLNRTLEFSSIIARGISGYLNSSGSGVTPDSYSVGWRSDYVLTLEMDFENAITNVTNNTPVALYITGRIVFS